MAYLSDTDISLIDSCSKSRSLMLFYVACPSSSIYELGLVKISINWPCCGERCRMVGWEMDFGLGVAERSCR